MKFSLALIAPMVALVVITAGLFVFTPFVFTGRVTPGLQAGAYGLTGVDKENVKDIVAAYERETLDKKVTFVLGETDFTENLGSLGVSFDKDEMVERIGSKGLFDLVEGGEREIDPVLVFDKRKMAEITQDVFAREVDGPKNATLTFDNRGRLMALPSEDGEVVDVDKLRDDIKRMVVGGKWNLPVEVEVRKGEAQVQDDEIHEAREFANRLLTEGFEFEFEDEKILMKAYTVKRLIRFAPQVDPRDHSNMILGVKFDSGELSGYLKRTVSPEIDQPAQNARFVLKDDRVEQFALPREGRKVNIDKTAGRVASALAKRERSVKLVVEVTQPTFSDLDDIKDLGLTSKLSTGQSDYAGSPANRAYNIKVGANKYHGLMIPPGEEFSFNKFLGPVNAAAGFKPELVIKENVTIPEYGGGLCQVSTTLFRAALNAGLEITQRRSHSYAVSYYGKPGLDATIYPPYTDLRFLNNTPGYILIQARIEGTKLAFDFWGTDDGREVNIVGPVTYDYKEDGSVKAYVEQEVVLGDKVIVDETFNSYYKSPELFPKVLAANGEAPPRDDKEKQEVEDKKEKDNGIDKKTEKQSKKPDS